MPLQTRWVDANDEDALDRVAVARLRAYAPAAADLAAVRSRLAADPRAAPGDWLLAELDGEPVGTATSLSMATWVRGGHAWCQGVAYVGTARTHRRGGSTPATDRANTGDKGVGDKADRRPGVASQVMRAVLDRARERQQCVSALMPFRNSFYERFGYGVVERRNEWTVPTALLPAGDYDGFRHFNGSAADFDLLAACRQRLVCRGQLDVKRTRAAWEAQLARQAKDGWFYVDRPDAAGPVRGYVGFETIVRPDGRWHLKVTELGYADAAGLRRALHLLAGQRDQYATASLVLAADLPLNRLLKESQVPHRVVPHAAAECRPHTRMMVRVLDHAGFLGAMTELPTAHRGRAVVAVHEPEGTTSTFSVEVGDGRAVAALTGLSPQFECSANAWAAVACGDVAAAQAVRLGLAACHDPAAAAALDALAAGPPPFCTEAF